MTEIRCPIDCCKNNKFQENYGMGICQAPIIPLDTEEVHSEDESEEPESLFRCLAFTHVKSKLEPPKFAATLEEEEKQFNEFLKRELALKDTSQEPKERT